MIKDKNKDFKLHPHMSDKGTTFYWEIKESNFDFSAERISSDCSVLLRGETWTQTQRVTKLITMQLLEDHLHAGSH